MTQDEVKLATFRRTLKQVRELADLASGHPAIHGGDGQAIPEAIVALIDRTLEEAGEGD